MLTAVCFLTQISHFFSFTLFKEDNFHFHCASFSARSPTYGGYFSS